MALQISYPKMLLHKIVFLIRSANSTNPPAGNISWSNPGVFADVLAANTYFSGASVVAGMELITKKMKKAGRERER